MTPEQLDPRGILTAVAKPTRTQRAPTRLRKVNPRRRRAALAKDFGDLAVVVRRLPCCVAGCAAGPSDPAHVRSRGSGQHAWLEVDGGRVGNIAPLCRPHHDEQGRGIQTFNRGHRFTVRWVWATGAMGWFPVADLAAAAALVGRLFEGRST